jgi:DNA recombination protein RmuC
MNTNQLLVGLGLGVLLGAAFASIYFLRRSESDRSMAARAAHSEGLLNERITDLQETLRRERDEHEKSVAQQTDRFKVVANEALEGVISRYGSSQVEALEQREAKLDERLQPLRDVLHEYKTKVEELEQKRNDGYSAVEVAAKNLFDAQQSSLEETRKLTTILGRSADRGRWGEIQLERIFELSHMTKHVDYDTQTGVSSASGKSLRPDAIVRLPNKGNIAVDSKVPFDAFERAMATNDSVLRDQELSAFARDVKGHVKSLKEKAYWQAISPSPEFVVCFVPSDHLLSAAFNSDNSLLEFALESRVLIAGPTTLMALLSTIAVGWSQASTIENIHDIEELATRLVDRTATLFSHTTKLGKSIDAVASAFNSVVGSLEQNLLVTMREIQNKGVKGEKTIGTVGDVTAFTRPLVRDRWPLPEGEEPRAIDAVLLPDE